MAKAQRWPAIKIFELAHALMDLKHLLGKLRNTGCLVPVKSVWIVSFITAVIFRGQRLYTQHHPHDGPDRRTVAVRVEAGVHRLA